MIKLIIVIFSLVFSSLAKSQLEINLCDRDSFKVYWDELDRVLVLHELDSIWETERECHIYFNYNYIMYELIKSYILEPEFSDEINSFLIRNECFGAEQKSSIMPFVKSIKIDFVLDAESERKYLDVINFLDYFKCHGCVWLKNIKKD